VGDVSEIGDRLDGAREVARVLADDRSGRGLAHECSTRRRRHARSSSGPASTTSTPRAEHVERSGDGVVLGESGHYAITGTEQAEQHEVHRLRAAGLEDRSWESATPRRRAHLATRRAIARAVSSAMR
jgi:hypothetical protein